MDGKGGEGIQIGGYSNSLNCLGPAQGTLDQRLGAAALETFLVEWREKLNQA
ncbi:hypothetical protein DSO57_1009070, partial [Entomophthora muscae]